MIDKAGTTRTAGMVAALAALGSILPLQTACAAEGFYFGIGYATVALDGDFDGESVIEGDGPTAIIPSFDATGGYSVLGGLERGNLASEFGYTRADLDGSWSGQETTGEYTAYTVDVRYIFRHRSRVRPVVIAGLGVRRLDVIDGSTDGVRLEDAGFRGGFDWRLGVGADINLAGRINLDLQAIYRFSTFDELNAIGSRLATEDLDADGVTLLAAIKYTFGK